ncbi:MAG: SHOCT domain-containing protein [Vulcanimicrobiota bacterium]
MEVLGPVLGLCFGLLAGVWVYEDAKKRGMSADSAAVWGLGVALLLIICLPLYLAGRPPLPGSTQAQSQLAEQLVQLEALKGRGTLSDEEFLQAKNRLLSLEPSVLSPCPPQPGTAISGSRVLAVLLLALGGLLVLGAFNMDVSVAVPEQTFMGQTIGGGRVNNIGLMNDRQNLLMVGCVLSIGGLLLSLSGGRK